eukprot:RCo045250
MSEKQHDDSKEGIAANGELPSSSKPFASSEFALVQPYTHLLSVPGKGVRGMLIDAFNLWIHVGADQVSKVKSIIEKLHNASLLVDDIEDNSQLRRGIPVAHTIFGVAHTINCANLVYFLAFNDVCALGQPAAVEAFRDELIRLHRGQGQDIWWRDNFICPTEQEYKSMVMMKTGGLFRLAVRLMQACTDDPQGRTIDLNPIVDDFAVYFQIRDDYMNLQSTEYGKNKDFCEDITEGKYSFPMIHHISCAKDDQKLQKILRQRTTEQSLKRYALRLMRATGSLTYTRQVVIQYFEKMLSRIDELGGNPGLQKIVSKLQADFLKAED